MIFTNYFANSFIVRQTTLISSNIDKLNLRLVRAFIYLSQFRLNVKYYFDKLYVILDVLLHLLATKSSIEANFDNLETFDLDNYYNKYVNLKLLNQIYIYQDTLIVIILEFKNKILDKYVKKNL